MQEARYANEKLGAMFNPPLDSRREKQHIRTQFEIEQTDQQNQESRSAMDLNTGEISWWIAMVE